MCWLFPVSVMSCQLFPVSVISFVSYSLCRLFPVSVIPCVSYSLHQRRTLGTSIASLAWWLRVGEGFPAHHYLPQLTPAGRARSFFIFLSASHLCLNPRRLLRLHSRACNRTRPVQLHNLHVMAGCGQRAAGDGRVATAKRLLPLTCPAQCKALNPAARQALSV